MNDAQASEPGYTRLPHGASAYLAPAAGAPDAGLVIISSMPGTTPAFESTRSLELFTTEMIPRANPERSPQRVAAEETV